MFYFQLIMSSDIHYLINSNTKNSVYNKLVGYKYEKYIRNEMKLNNPSKRIVRFLISNTVFDN